ncbi:hypothetical protein K3H44_17580 [Aeromonas veronii]|uniref:hypothetical protein n=1 Tax=Aeromonas veronii TaxID=654 RepID=UPI001F41FD01|nr:hypothetical protein [Aeromonas veronii]MCF5857081.1 hypothetical protein [Aeromonas veronii]
MAHAKTASKDHQNPQWEQSQTSKSAKNRQKDRFFSHGFTLRGVQKIIEKSLTPVSDI